MATAFTAGGATNPIPCAELADDRPPTKILGFGMGGRAGVSVFGTTVSIVHNLYIEPGVTALLGFGLWFVGADVNLFLTPGLNGNETIGGGTNSKAAFMANGQVGVKF